MAVRQARPTAAQQSDAIDLAARIGLVAYAVVYLLIGWLAIQLALGDREGAPSSTGAMRELTQHPAGGVLIWAVSIGMFLLVVWMLLDATFGHRDEDEKSTRVGKRLGSAGKAVIYAAIGASGLRIALGSSSSGKSEETWTAKVLDLPGGQVLVGLGGLAIIGYGGFQIYRAWTAEFADQLDAEGRSGTTGAVYIGFGRAGHTARGVAFVVLGGLFGQAALNHDASKAGGLDQALAEFLDKPFGPILLAVVGAGLMSFGVFTLARARHLSR